jgi:hypothetical protein
MCLLPVALVLVLGPGALAKHLSPFVPAQGESNLPTVQPQQPHDQALLITVVDENAVAVPSARVILEKVQPPGVLRGESNYAGRYEFTNLLPGSYHLRVEKEGFYAVVQNDVPVGEVESLEITLNHVREFTEVVNVVYSPPAIDPAKVEASETLNSQEIINVPYPVARDIRYALPFLPGVLPDAYGQIHLDGSSTRQIFDQLDGFNITDPASGLFNMRVSVDALRSVEVQSSRYPAEYGKGSGGVLSLRTGMGDDHLRFSATDFFPSLQSRKGIYINTWTPRASVSGPLRKGKAWFLEAADGEYNLNIVKELPPGGDRNPVWRLSNLSKAQINLTPGNILTAGLLVNRFNAEHAGLSRFTPVETTVNQSESAYLLTLRDQALLANDTLLEVGLGVSRFRSEFQPLGDQTYVLHPEGTSGNFFETAWGRASRLQGIVNLILPPRQWLGRHEFKLGTDLDRVTVHQTVERNPVLILREDGTLSRKIAYAASPAFTRTNFEVSGYAQDRWSLSPRCLLEPGVRFDWDEVVRDPVLSPRLASTLLLRRDGDTKLAWGVGIYHDATNLDFLTRPQTGRRVDLFYDPSGQALVRPPVETSFLVNEQALKQPRFLNWSMGLERKLPTSIYLQVQFVQRRGRRAWTFLNRGAAPPDQFSGRFELGNERHDRYDGLEVTLRRTFKGNHVAFASYTHSAARSNAVLNFSIDNPLFSQQAGGPLPWDSPNRFISWGFLPLPWKFDLAYSLDWREGYPFLVVNQDQQLVGSPGSHRFPTYFSLNLQVERRLHLLGYQWALRAGFDDFTNRHNPGAVDNNVDSPHFLSYGALQGRALVARVRLLGRK